ncbi:hypothetical protein ACSBR1_018433 [Camellia fascicularis]
MIAGPKMFFTLSVETLQCHGKGLMLALLYRMLLNWSPKHKHCSMVHQQLSHSASPQRLLYRYFLYINLYHIDYIYEGKFLCSS